MKRTIQSKIIVSFCTLMIFMLVAQIAFNVFFSKEYFISQNKTELEALYEKIKISYSDDQENLYNLTAEEDMIAGFSVQIFSETKIIYTSRNIIQSNNQMPLYHQYNLQSLNSEDFSLNPDAVILENDASTLISISGKFFYEGEYRYISITKAVESIENSIMLFTKANILISIVVLLVGTIFVIIFAKGISNPIKDIKIVSENIAMLDFSYCANENASTTELSSLAKSINSMSSQLSEYMGDLQMANLKLQDDIKYQKYIDDNRKQFIANVSHEMKTPLALLQIYCENLKSDIEDIDKEEYYDVILDETSRLDTIVKNMLNISSIENGLAKMIKEKYDVSESCENIINSIIPLSKNFEIVTDIQKNIDIYADKQQIDEAMRNYIMNAISHVKTGGFIKIKLIESHQLLKFSVFNEGEYIDENEIDNIWESFYKLDKSRTRKLNSSSGLGLYIVKLTIKNHNGEYGVSNKKNGVEFNFTLTSLS